MLMSTPRSPDRRDAAERELELLEQLTRWMDRRYVDPVLGFLVPGAGDVLGSVLGVLGVVVAFRLRVHPVVIARMLLNLALDSLLGMVPLLGDVADIFYRAHSKNLVLIQDRGPYEAEPSDWLIVAGAALLFLMAVSLPIVVGVTVVRWLWGFAG